MQKKSIYKYASELGVPAGLYLTLMSACLLFSVKIPVLPVLLLPLAIGFPFLLWTLMKKIVKEEPSYKKFSSLWLGGIYTVIFGTLICMFFSGIYLVMFEPGFVHLYVMNAIEAVENSAVAGDYESSIIMMRQALESHILPSGMEFLTTMGWFTCFIGSMMSLIIALIMSQGAKRVRSQYPV